MSQTPLTLVSRRSSCRTESCCGDDARVGWDALTERELHVAELVSHGLRYREIAEHLYVSRRTVETHVAHVFVKLGVRSKAGLAAAYVIRFGAAQSA